MQPAAAFLFPPGRRRPVERGPRATLLGQRFVPVDASDMIREVHGFGHEESELQTHLVGLQPRHSANAPDAWETDALKRLAEGEPEVSSERTIGGTTFLQTMRPLIVEQSCLKCHAEQGYRVGELRGGISISVPFAPLWPVEKAEMLRSIASYGSMWLFGLCSIFFGARQLRRQIEQRIETEEALRKREGQMIAAQQLQERLFPERPPGLAGFDIAGASFPAEFTSGDYYDYIPLPEMCYAIVVGDVSGHGLGPALLMASARSILRSIARTAGDVSEILTLAEPFVAGGHAAGSLCHAVSRTIGPRVAAVLLRQCGTSPGLCPGCLGKNEGPP